MSRFMSTSTNRAVISTLAACVLTAALPQAGIAAPSEAGLWKIDTAKSKIVSGTATLTIERVGSVSPSAGRFVVVSRGRVYLVTRATAYDSNGIKRVDYARMTRDGNATLVGTDARSTGVCGFRCQSGLPEPRLTLTFKAVNGGRQQINDMLASDAQKQ